MSKEKIRGFIVGVIVMTLIFSMSISAYALIGSKSITASYNNIKIYIDQKLITPKDVNGKIVEPFIYNGTTYLPVRAVGEALGKLYLGTAKPIPFMLVLSRGLQPAIAEIILHQIMLHKQSIMLIILTRTTPQ
jgi:ribosomal protein S19